MNLKTEAARRAMDYVRSGMALGLGSGSTAAFFVDMLGAALEAGALQDIVGVPTSGATAERARAMNIPLATLAERPRLDLAVDGADEVDPDLDLIKGLGRALLREKIVELHAERLVIVVDESKLTKRLGSLGPLPVELLPFGVEAHLRWLNSLDCRAELWYEEDGAPVLTENGNHLARLWFAGGIRDPHALARTLADRPGIIEHGLFLDMATDVVVAGTGGIGVLKRTEGE